MQETQDGHGGMRGGRCSCGVGRGRRELDLQDFVEVELTGHSDGSEIWRQEREPKDVSA